MKIFTLEKQQQINRPLREVFQFFENPENLLKITPKWLNLRVLTPTPIQMRLGMIIDYTVKPLLFEDRWTTMITHYEAPYKFVDEQLKGPY